jgi:hypothetical protein
MQNVSDKQTIEKKIEFVLMIQSIAAIRNVPVKKRYIALAEDMSALMQGHEAVHSKKLI